MNFADPDFNIGLPVFTIHGNHDDPSGPDNVSAVDLLSTGSLVNYFGKVVRHGRLSNCMTLPHLSYRSLVQHELSILLACKCSAAQPVFWQAVLTVTFSCLNQALGGSGVGKIQISPILLQKVHCPFICSSTVSIEEAALKNQRPIIIESVVA